MPSYFSDAENSPRNETKSRRKKEEYSHGKFKELMLKKRTYEEQQEKTTAKETISCEARLITSHSK